MSAPIELEVVGVPAPQGSKTRFGKVMVDGTSKAGREKLAAWRDAVRAKARQWVEANEASPLAEPLEVSIEFRFAPTKSNPHRHHHQTTPDIDKLVRSTFDSLKLGGLIADDALICTVIATKRYAHPESPLGRTVGATIRVASLGSVEAAHVARSKAVAAEARRAAKAVS